MNLAVCRPKNKNDSCLRDKISMITLKEKPRELFNVKAKLREKPSEAELERGRMIRDKRNSDWAAVYGTNSLPESQKSELHHVNQWACQSQVESRRIFEELTTKSRRYQENHALHCMEIEELRRICHEETERARQSRTDELQAQKKGELSTVNQLLSQIGTLQDKVNALSDEK